MPYIQFVEGLMSLLFRLGEKHFSYTIDISGVGCHCNAAAYFVVAQNNPFPGKDGSHYIVRIQNYVSGCIVIHTNCFFPCCLVVQNMMHGKVTNTQWMSIVGLVGKALIMEHGLIVLMVLGAIFTSTFGGPGYDSSWLDGMTKCKGELYCNLAESSVSFSHFELD